MIDDGDDLDLDFGALRDTMREGEALGDLDTDLEDFETDSAAMTELRREPGAEPETSDWGETLIHHTAFDEPASSSQSSSEPSVLEVVGSYEVIGRLGYGAMAEVLLARSSGERGFARKVAIKRLLPEVAANPDTVEMFIDEARISSSLNHGNIAQVIDFGKVGHTYYIAMEHVEGTSLRAILDYHQQRGLPPALASHVVAKIAAALEYAHTRNDEQGRPRRIVHRDVKPSNVLLSVDAEVKLIDFGVAKAAERVHHTLGSTIKGSFAYMSPEQAGAGHVDQRSDIFSCGTVLYELIAGDNPFIGVSAVDTLERVRHVHMAPLKSVVKNVPAELERICNRAMATELRERYQSAGEMQADLERFTQRSVKITEIKRALGALVSEVAAHQREEDAVPPSGAQPRSGGGMTAKTAFERPKPKARHGTVDAPAQPLRVQHTMPIDADSDVKVAPNRRDERADDPTLAKGARGTIDRDGVSEVAYAKTTAASSEPDAFTAPIKKASAPPAAGLRPAPTTLDASSFPELAALARRDTDEEPARRPSSARMPVEPRVVVHVDTGQQQTVVKGGHDSEQSVPTVHSSAKSPRRAAPQRAAAQRSSEALAIHRAPTTLEPEPSSEIVAARKAARARGPRHVIEPTEAMRRQSRELVARAASKASSPSSSSEPPPQQVNVRLWLIIGAAVVLSAFVAGLVVAMVR